MTPKLLQKMEKVKAAVYRKSTKLPVHGHQIHLNGIKETQLRQTYILQNEFLQTLKRKLT